MTMRLGRSLAALAVLAGFLVAAAPPAPGAPALPCIDPTGVVCGNGLPGLVTDAAGGVAEAGFDAMAKSFGKTAEELIVKTTTAWTKVPATGAAQSDTAGWLGVQLAPLTAFAAVIGLIVAASKMAISRKGQDLNTALVGLFRLLAVTAAGTTVLVLVLAGGDEFAAGIIDRSTGNGLNTITTLFTAGGMGSPLVFMLGLLAILTSIIQIGVLLVRSALLVVLIGIWPLSAAASVAGEAGTQMFKKVTGWIVAFALYKPAAAIVYAAAFKLMAARGDLGDETLASIQGVLLLAMAVIALPAMIRLVVPATSALGSGMSTGGAVAGVATLATGAIAIGATGGGAAAGGAAMGSSTSAGSAAMPAAGGGGSNSGGGDGGPSGGKDTGPTGGGSATPAVSAATKGTEDATGEPSGGGGGGGAASGATTSSSSSNGSGAGAAGASGSNGSNSSGAGAVSGAAAGASGAASKDSDDDGASGSDGDR